jgi:hypothetical protein
MNAKTQKVKEYGDYSSSDKPLAQQSVAELIASMRAKNAAAWERIRAFDTPPQVSEETYNEPKPPEPDYSGLINALEIEALAGYIAYNMTK